VVEPLSRLGLMQSTSLVGRRHELRGIEGPEGRFQTPGLIGSPSREVEYATDQSRHSHASIPIRRVRFLVD